jgi:DNA-binding PadR family transcriptional regulator
MSEPKLTHTTMMVLHAIDAGYVYGLSIMDATGLPSGTVYPILRRLEAAKFVRSAWEAQKVADAEQRPARKYYKLTASGGSTLESARRRFPLLAGLKPAPSGNA